MSPDPRGPGAARMRRPSRLGVVPKWPTPRPRPSRRGRRRLSRPRLAPRKPGSSIRQDPGFPRPGRQPRRPSRGLPLSLPLTLIRPSPPSVPSLLAPQTHTILPSWSSAACRGPLPGPSGRSMPSSRGVSGLRTAGPPRPFQQDLAGRRRCAPIQQARLVQPRADRRSRRFLPVPTNRRSLRRPRWRMHRTRPERQPTPLPSPGRERMCLRRVQRRRRRPP